MLRSLSLVVVSSAVLLLLNVLQSSAADQYEGVECTVNGRPGICEFIQNCEEVRNALLGGNPPGHLCGYERYDPVVCCPTNSTDRTANRNKGSDETPIAARGAISRAKCEEYSQAVFELQRPPVLLLNPKPENVSLCVLDVSKLIVGGTKAVPKEFPHMAALGYNTDSGLSWLCGGSLISERFVLTAAHCVYGPNRSGPVKVRLGDLNLVRTDDIAKPQDFGIIKTIKHHDYSGRTVYHDIALLKLDREVVFNEWIRPACLPYSLPDVGTDNMGTVTGWGRIEYEADFGSADLLKVTVNLVTQRHCNYQYNGVWNLPDGIIDKWQFCAGDIAKDTCQGDSGGPMVILNKDYYCMYSVFGVTSLGQSCGNISPGVYTRVYNYIPWIESIVWPDS